MSIGLFLSTLAAFLGFGASIFFIIGSIRFSKESILELATPHWDYHSEIAKMYAEQKWLYTFGAILLILAFIAQAISLAPLQVNLTMTMPPALGFIVTGIIAITLFIGTFLLCKFIIQNTVRSIDKMSEDQIKQAEENERKANIS